MLAVSSSPHRNRLLASLSPGDLGLLQPHLKPLTLKVRYELERPNKRIDDIYFMEFGIASVVAVQSHGTRVEVGLVGCEGMTALDSHGARQDCRQQARAHPRIPGIDAGSEAGGRDRGIA